MTTVAETLHALMADLHLQLLDAEHACGDIADFPATVTLISTEPLVLSFDFRVQLPAVRLDEIRPLLQGLSNESLRVSAHQNEVQLALMNLTGQTSAEIEQIVTEFAESLTALGLGLPDGCLYCGTTENVEIVHHLGRTSRACPTCFSQRLEQHAQEHAERLQPRRNAWMSVPMLCFYVAIGWVVIWAIADALLDWFHVQVIDLNKFTSMVLFVAALAIGGALGTPLGSTLKKTGLVRKSPRWIGGLVVVAAVALGEVLYLTWLIFRAAGVVDLTFAVQMLPALFGVYSSFWILLKVGLALSIGFFTIIAIEEPLPVKSAL